jgi:hypothetical protein
MKKQNTDTVSPLKDEKFKKFWVKSVNNWLCDADYDGNRLKEKSPTPTFRKYYFIKSWEGLSRFTTHDGYTNRELVEKWLEIKPAAAIPSLLPDTLDKNEMDNLEDDIYSRALPIQEGDKLERYTPGKILYKFNRGLKKCQTELFTDIEPVPFAFINHNEPNYSEQEANAARIVLTWNLHDTLKAENTRLKEYNKVLLEALKDVSPLIDELIFRLPTGKNRTEVCDFNIKIKAAIQKENQQTTRLNKPIK